MAAHLFRAPNPRAGMRPRAKKRPVGTFTCGRCTYCGGVCCVDRDVCSGHSDLPDIDTNYSQEERHA